MSVATDEEVRRFSRLEYEDFRRLAVDPTLGPNERIGFPDRYRAGFEDAIFDDVVGKLPRLHERGLRVLEIGPGAARCHASCSTSARRPTTGWCGSTRPRCSTSSPTPRT